MFSWGISNAALFLASILLALACIWRAWSRRREASGREQAIRALVVLGSCLVALVCMPSLLVIQKFLTKLVMPPGLLWLGLVAVGVVLWRARMRVLSSVVWAMWLLLSLAGNEMASRALMAALEKDFAAIDPLKVASRDNPFDLVVCLGGATQVTPAGQVAVTEAGDRAVLAARLYHAGHARLLTATGRANEEILGPGRHPADEARIVWQSLGVPGEAIRLLGGATTKEEFELIAKEAQRHAWRRIGVVTSAWHMRRAMRLAEAAGVRVEPLPADFVGVVPTWDRFSIVPKAQSLHETSLALKEFLARFAGR
jgi:uncharacterized SAM-binding protein YcdF (DUF218 family)